MQPFPPPALILAMHEEIIRAELAGEPNNRYKRYRQPPRPMRAIRRRIGQALIGLGLLFDPSARQPARS